MAEMAPRVRVTAANSWRDAAGPWLDVPITGHDQKKPIPLRTIATLNRTTVPSEINHTNLQSTIDLTMGVQGRDLGHIATDVEAVIARQEIDIEQVCALADAGIEPQRTWVDDGTVEELHAKVEWSRSHVELFDA